MEFVVSLRVSGNGRYLRLLKLRHWSPGRQGCMIESTPGCVQRGPETNRRRPHLIVWNFRATVLIVSPVVVANASKGRLVPVVGP
jgi:hypothetical protein